MKLNKTLATMRLLNFKAVASCNVNGSDLTFKLTDGSTITATYQDWC